MSEGVKERASRIAPNMSVNCKYRISDTTIHFDKHEAGVVNNVVKGIVLPMMDPIRMIRDGLNHFKTSLASPYLSSRLVNLLFLIWHGRTFTYENKHSESISAT